MHRLCVKRYIQHLRQRLSDKCLSSSCRAFQSDYPVRVSNISCDTAQGTQDVICYYKACFFFYCRDGVFSFCKLFQQCAIYRKRYIVNSKLFFRRIEYELMAIPFIISEREKSYLFICYFVSNFVLGLCF